MYDSARCCSWRLAADNVTRFAYAWVAPTWYPRPWTRLSLCRDFSVVSYLTLPMRGRSPYSRAPIMRTTTRLWHRSVSDAVPSCIWRAEYFAWDRDSDYSAILTLSRVPSLPAARILNSWRFLHSVLPVVGAQPPRCPLRIRYSGLRGFTLLGFGAENRRGGCSAPGRSDPGRAQGLLLLLLCYLFFISSIITLLADQLTNSCRFRS